MNRRASPELLAPPDSSTVALPDPGRIVPSVSVRNAVLERERRRLALLMILLPPAGIGAAAWTAVTTGFGFGELAIFFVMYALTTIGVTVGFHRHFTHRSFAAKRGIRLALGILGSMAIQGPLIFWTATHRRHHQFSDRDGDPHSPNLHGRGWRSRVQGQWHAHIRWLYAGDFTNSLRFANDLRRDDVAVWINRTYPLWAVLGLVLPALAGGLLIGGWLGALKGFLWGGLVRLFVVHHAFWSIGSIAHTFGKRPYATEDFSGNSWWLAVPNFGEGWHNNHHAFPWSAYFGLEWWQLDLGGLVVSALRHLHVVTKVKAPTPEQKGRKVPGQSDGSKPEPPRRSDDDGKAVT